VVSLTSIAAYFLGTRGLRLERHKLGRAGTEALEVLGLSMVFLVTNLAAGVCLILGARVLSGRFLSVYWINDSTLGLMSFLQAIVFHCWRRGAK
jgi:hypothetical protein